MKLNQLALLSSALVLFQSAHAQLLFSEGFNYTPGALGPASSAKWSGNAPAALTVGTDVLTYPGFASVATPGTSMTVTSGGSATTTLASLSSAATSGSVYYSFMAEPTSLGASGTTYLTSLTAGVNANGSTDPLAVYEGVSGSGMKIGVRSGGSQFFSPTVLALNTQYFVVVKYTFVSGTASAVSVWVNPATGGSETTPDATGAGTVVPAGGISSVSVKAQSGTTEGNWELGSMLIGQSWIDVTPGTTVTPEPDALTLSAVAGGLGLLYRRVRRS